MPNLVDKLTEAQKYAMSVRPKVGGVPFLAEALRRSGVMLNRWTLPSSQSIYIMREGTVVQQGTPIVIGTAEFPQFNREALIRVIRDDQAGLTDFQEFLTRTFEAGVVGYDVDFSARKVIYYGVSGESYIEEYQAVELP